MPLATTITTRWQAIDGTTGSTTYSLKAKRLRTANAMPPQIDAIDTIRAHSRNFNTREPVRKIHPQPRADECNGDPFSRISAPHCHNRNEKESERAKSENRCSEEGQNTDRRYTNGAFHVFTFPQALWIANAPADTRFKLR